MAERCLLYYITDRTAFAGDESTRQKLLLEKISEAARADIDYIQLREKDLATRKFEALARETVDILAKIKTENTDLRTRLLVNTRTDIALAAGADGVHLRSSDISPRDVKAIWEKHSQRTLTHGPLPSNPVIGVSCHTPEEVAQAAANEANFAVFAPVFEKKGSLANLAKGLPLLEQACRSDFPVFALGGINLSNAHSCIEAGAAGIAGIRLFQENEVAEIVKFLRRIF